MKNKGFLLLATLILTIAIGLGPLIFAEKLQTNVGIKRIKDDKAVKFTLVSTRGNKVTVPQEDQAIVLLFFSVNCLSCQSEANKWPEKVGALKRRKINVLGISQTGAKETEVFIRKYKINFPVLVDEWQVVSRLYSIDRIPYYLLINSKGNIAMRGQWVNILDHAGEGDMYE